MKKCPRCGLLNPEDGTICVCGFDLINGDPASVRGVVRRRGRLCQIGGLVLVVFGLAGGTSCFPIHISFFLSVESYRMDVPVVVAGMILLAYGARLVDRPWTERMKGPGAG